VAIPPISIELSVLPAEAGGEQRASTSPRLRQVSPHQVEGSPHYILLGRVWTVEESCWLLAIHASHQSTATRSKRRVYASLPRRGDRILVLNTCLAAVIRQAAGCAGDQLVFR
jgi:hypothetical protein